MNKNEQILAEANAECTARAKVAEAWWNGMKAEIEAKKARTAAELKEDSDFTAACGNPDGFWLVKDRGKGGAIFRAYIAEARETAKTWCEETNADFVEVDICTHDKKNNELVIVAKYRREWNEGEASEVETPCHLGAIYNASDIINA